MKNITITIPAKIRTPQEAEWLKIAIASIPADTRTIIVNDHSIVPWADVRKVVTFGTAKVKHLPEGLKGLAAARNYAMRFVDTEFFFPLDADDYLPEDALQIAMDKYPGDGFLYGSTVLFNDKQRSTYLARPYDICKLLEAVYWPNGCLQKTENCHAVNGWDESLILYEDWDYWLRSAKAGIIGHDIPDVLYNYRQNPNGIILTLRKNQDMQIRARDIIKTKHQDLFDGDDPMCAGCGKKNKKTNTPDTKPVNRNIPIPTPLSNGMVLLTYTGSGVESSYYGTSGTCYRFGAKRHKFGYVAQEDVPGLLKLKEAGRYCFTTEAAK